jgi:hypothetical protein
MKTILERVMRHGCSAVHEFRFRASCWWLSQQVEFLRWRMRLEIRMLSEPSTSTPTSVGQDDPYVMHPM